MKPIIVATGFTREVRTVEGPEIVAIAGGGAAERLEQALHQAAANGAAGIISYGLTGGLADGLRIGDWVVGDRLTGAIDHECHAAWIEHAPELFQQSDMLLLIDVVEHAIGEGNIETRICERNPATIVWDEARLIRKPALSDFKAPLGHVQTRKAGLRQVLTNEWNRSPYAGAEIQDCWRVDSLAA